MYVHTYIQYRYILYEPNKYDSESPVALTKLALALALGAALNSGELHSYLFARKFTTFFLIEFDSRIAYPNISTVIWGSLIRLLVVQ